MADFTAGLTAIPVSMLIRARLVAKAIVPDYALSSHVAPIFPRLIAAEPLSASTAVGAAR
jgi:hypothetical protein